MAKFSRQTPSSGNKQKVNLQTKSLSFQLVDLVDFKPTVGPKVNHLKAKRYCLIKISITLNCSACLQLSLIHI